MTDVSQEEIVTDTSASIVFIDDDVAASSALIRRVSREEPSYEYHYFSDSHTAISHIKKASPEVAVVDLELDASRGPASGLSVIREIFNFDPTIRILALTGHSASEVGVSALRAGAASFLQKPAELSHLVALLRDGVAYARLKRDKLSTNDPETKLQLRGLHSNNKRMCAVIQQIQYAAASAIPVLLLGETGTGKGILARAIHELGARSKKRFIRLQPQFGSADLAASELFGHCKGAFTGAISARQGLLEQANLGTLFLDEVNHLPQEIQVSMLELLQEGTYRKIGDSRDSTTNIRLISASNLPEQELVSATALRQDFYHRIAHCTIVIPPLRERREDIPMLAQSFLTELATREELSVDGYTPDALTFLEQQVWPGNVRQLQGAVESAVYRASFHKRTLVDYEDVAADAQREKNDHSVGTSTGSFRDQVREFEQSLVLKALQESDNNQSHAAHRLQLDRSSFRRILNRSKDKP